MLRGIRTWVPKRLAQLHPLLDISVEEASCRSGDEMAVLFLLAVGSAAADAEGARVLEKEVVVHAPAARVWQVWTTEEGLRFISSRSRVELREGGPYEWFLDLEPDENGRRGGEGARVLGFTPEEQLRFTWTFPPSVPGLRKAGATTVVTVRFRPNEDGSTTVRLVQSGWKTGAEWDAGFAYFDRAWGFVLERLRQTLEGTPPE